MEQQDQRERGERGGQRERHYHHGDLRRALLDAALQLASERGIANFTLREVARLAGVSHNAPYHHFEDKAALVEALAIENFEILEKDLQAAHERTKGTPLDKLVAAGVAYVHFALQHPAAFRLMFRPELYEHAHEGQSEQSEVELAGRTAHQTLLAIIRECQQAGLIATDKDLQLLGLAAWSTMHGLAILLLDSSAQKLLPEPVNYEQLSEQVAQTLISGLKIRRDA